MISHGHHRLVRYMRIYIKNKIYFEVDSFSQRGILTLNNFYSKKTIRMREKTCNEKLKNTTPKYQNASTQSRAIKNTKNS